MMGKCIRAIQEKIPANPDIKNEAALKKARLFFSQGTSIIKNQNF
jgi:hypothetical protein